MGMRFKNPRVGQLENSVSEAICTKLSDEEAFKLVPFDENAVERTGYSNYSYWRSTFRAFRKNTLAMALVCIVLGILIFTFIQPYLPNQLDSFQSNIDPKSGAIFRNLEPGTEVTLENGKLFKFILGTNELGQDLWSRLWGATRTSLLIGVAVACIEAIIGIAAGSIEKLILSGRLIIGYRAFKQVSEAVQLMIVFQIGKNLVFTVQNIVGVQVAVVLLCRADDLNRIVSDFLQLRIRMLGQRVADCLNPFVEITVLKYKSVKLVILRMCRIFRQCLKATERIDRLPEFLSLLAALLILLSGRQTMPCSSRFQVLRLHTFSPAVFSS